MLLFNKQYKIVDIYDSKVITALLVNIFFFLAYSEIYSYVFCLLHIFKITKALTLLSILLSLHDDATTRLAKPTDTLATAYYHVS